MDIEAVRNTLEQASLASLAIGLAIGFFFSFNPVALAAIPVSLAYVTKAQAPQRAVLLGSMFVLGMIVTQALLGLVVGLGGGWIQRFISREWGLVLGPASIVMGLAWPWGALAPLNPVRALQYYSHFWEKPWQELFDGMLIAIPEMPRSYVPKLLFLKLPEGFMVLALAGLVGALVAVWRGNMEPWRRAGLALILVTAVMPIALVVATRPVLYNGVRHFLFVLPPLAIIAGLAGAYIIHSLAARTRLAAAAAAAALAASVGLSVYDLARMHPYQYAQFNRVAGGLRGADDRYMIDYWGLGLKEAAETLRDRIEEGHVTPPRGRRWKVAVCGPSQTLLVELGSGFDVTNEAPGADFAISLGTFYCAELDAPIVAEVERDGVVLARAYDLRGRSYVTTWSYPPVTDKSAEARGADRHP